MILVIFLFRKSRIGF